METNNSANEARGFYKLNWLQRIGFGSGDLAQNLIFQTVACYLMIYLTTVLSQRTDSHGPTHRLLLESCRRPLHRQSQSQVRQVSHLPALRRYPPDGGCLPVDASAGCHLVHDHEVNLRHCQLYRAEHDLFRGQHPLRFHHGQYDPR